MSFIGASIYNIRVRLKEKAFQSRFRKNIQQHTPVIVYQMGKVGSMSIYTSLKEQYPGITLHRHELDTPTDWQAQTLLQCAKAGQPLKLISMVREPVGRNISAFFQNFEMITGVKPTESKFTQQELEKHFFTNPGMDHNVPLTWFNENVNRHFGIDVYAEPFNTEQGWAVIKKGNVELLLMKAEISDSVKEELLQKYTGLSGFRLQSSNVGEDKDYAALYNEFKKNIALPSSYIDKLYNALQVTHFYTAAELATARKKWKLI